MKIYKKDLNEFIEKVEEKAVNSIFEKHSKIIKDSKDKRFLVYENEIKDIENLLLKAHKKALLISENQNNWTAGYYCEKHIRESITYCKNVTSKDMKDTELEDYQVIERKKEISATRTEYLKVKSYIKNNTPKKGYEYLKEIGFDVASIPVYDNNGSNCTAVIVKVDTNKLFVCGDNE